MKLASRENTRNAFPETPPRETKAKHGTRVSPTRKSSCGFIPTPQADTFTNPKVKRLSRLSPPQDDMTSFYNTPPLGRRGTCSYLTKVVMNLLLEGEVKPNSDDPCLVS